MSNGIKSSDGALLERWTAQRDAEAFAELVARYAGLVYGTCRRVLGNATDAEDAAQECFMKLSQADPKVGRSLGGWLHRVATNRCLDRVKSETRRRDRESRYSEMARNSEEPSWQDIQSYVDQAIAELPDHLQMPVVQHFLPGKNQGGVARTLGVSRSAISRRIQRGTDRIRKSLKKRGIPITTGSLATIMSANLAEAAPESLVAALGKLALAGTGKTVGSAAATSVVAVGGVVLIKKLVIGVTVVIVGAIALWGLKPETPVEPEVEIAQVEQLPVQVGEDLSQTIEDQGPDLATDAETPAPEPASVPEASVTADATLGSISGQVYKAETGEPISEVQIYLKGEERNTRTDEDGYYRLDDLAAGTYRVRYRGSGLPRFNEEQLPLVTLKEGEVADGVDIPIAMGLRVAGRVVDTEGYPVTGAYVEGRDRNDGRSLADYTTSEDGTFELLGFKQTDKLTLEAEKGYELVSAQYGPTKLGPEGLSDVVLTLYPTASISGEVVDAQGRPIANVRVNPSPTTEHQRLMGLGSARTTDDGSFKLEGLAAGTYKMLLLREGTVSYKRPAPPYEEIELAHGEHIDGITLVLEIDDGLAIAGHVVDEREDPVVSAMILFQGGSTSTFARSNADGEYKIVGLTEGLYRLQVEHEEYAKVIYENVPAGRESFDIVLQPRGAIEGQVLDDATGRPIADFQILHIDDYNSHFVGVRENFERRRDEDGRFRIEAVEPGPATIVAKAPGYGESSVDVPYVGVGETVRDVEIRLKGGASVKGVVVDTDGDPIANAGIIPGEIPEVKHPSTAVVTRTDADGAFRLSGLSSGLQVISAYHPDYAVASVPVELAADRKNAVTIVLPKGGIVEGTVYYDGEPWPGQEVRLLAGRAQGGPIPVKAVLATTSESGSYRFEHVKPGQVGVLVVAWLRFNEETRQRRWLSQTATVVDGETTVIDVLFAPVSAAVEGLITFDGEPVPEAHATLVIDNPGGREQRYVRVGSDGWYQFEDVPAGRATIHVQSRMTDTSLILELEIGEGQIVRQDVEISGSTS